MNCLLDSVEIIQDNICTLMYHLDHVMVIFTITYTTQNFLFMMNSSHGNMTFKNNYDYTIQNFKYLIIIFQQYLAV